MTTRDRRGFDYARHMAEMSDYNRVHIGCVIMIGNKVVSTGFNTQKSHPLQKHYNQFRDFDGSNISIDSLHAEMSALIPLKNSGADLSKARMYVYRTRKDIQHGMCRPCPGCMAAIKSLGIKDVYYTTNDGLVHEVIN